jgi:hypothetical protein
MFVLLAHELLVRRDSSVGIAIRIRSADRGIGVRFLVAATYFFRVPRPALGFIQLPM